MAPDYNKTLNFLKTDFAMRANLPQREPDMLKQWEINDIYGKLMEKNEGKPLFILHDGPPYANGDIHLGTALNKTLKDIIIKYKNMSGFKAPYVPGWDTHGLPIELKALKAKDVDATSISAIDLRKSCKDFALSYVNVQRKQFERLGVIGDFDNPYLTLQPQFEAKQIEIFGEMAKKDYIYKGLKPVYWCADCNTALAEAEIEYENDKCYSIYVKFNLKNDNGIFDNLGINKDKISFVIWTTTTWTLPGNVAICLGPNYEYTLVKVNDEYYVMAKELVESTMKACKIENYEYVGSFTGKQLENITTKHPFLNRNSLVIIGDHITLESGTGCVHTAPGHGVDDFEVCKKYKDLEIVVPVDNKGYLTDLAGEFSGLSLDAGSKAIAKKLEDTGNLLTIQKMEHQYPHCWRCKEPIIFRATEQWFCSVEGFSEQAINAISNVNWIPAWGEERIKGMVRDRSDWCISRQRNWGVPIPILYCKDCGKVIVNDTTIKDISNLFREKGSDAWYYMEPSDFISNSVKCECGCSKFDKESDIMDVWFDSGTSHAAVLSVRDDLRWPADLYLEGADQYRGWLQSSLLTSVAWKGQAPYKAVCTHGWVVDGQGRKMSKSIGNGIIPEDIIKQYGADILRLWVASSDYHTDIRISQEILKQLSEGYRKIRNTARFILGNLENFNSEKDMVDINEIENLDKWAIYKLNNLIDKVQKAYNDLDFHIVYHSIHNFCVVDMSNFYLDILKDRLYCEKIDSKTRRCAQSVMYIIINTLNRLIAPILSFTADEIWKSLPHNSCDNADSIFLNDMLPKISISTSDEFIEKWNKIYNIREDIKKALEIKRADKVIGSSLDAKVTLYCNDDLFEFVNLNKNELCSIFIVSNVEVLEDGQGEFTGEYDGLSVTVEKADGNKCERCWVYSDNIGANKLHPTICERCADVLEN